MNVGKSMELSPNLDALLDAIYHILKGRLTLIAPETPATSSGLQTRQPEELPADSHWHWEIFLPLIEDGRYRVGEACYTVKPRMAIICERWIPHAILPSPGPRTPYHLIIHGHENVWCNIPIADAKGDYQTLESLWVTMPLELSVFVHTRWTAFRESALPQKRAAETLLRRPVELVLEEYLRLVSDHGASRTSEAPASIITMVKGRMESLNGVDCSLANMARFAGYSRFALAHLFKAQTGMSIGEYRNQIRFNYVSRAQVLGLKTKEIGVGLGFSSASAYLNWKRTQSGRRLDVSSEPEDR